MRRRRRRRRRRRSRSRAARSSGQMMAFCSRSAHGVYWHPVCSKQLWETAPLMQPGLYTHVKSVLIYAPLPPCTRGHRAGSVWLRLSHPNYCPLVARS
jgi:hypothetical protein